MREKRFEVRFTEFEIAQLEALARRYGETKAGLIRRLVRELAREFNADQSNQKIEEGAREPAEIVQ